MRSHVTQCQVKIKKKHTNTDSHAKAKEMMSEIKSRLQCKLEFFFFFKGPLMCCTYLIENIDYGKLKDSLVFLITLTIIGHFDFYPGYRLDSWFK